MAHFLKTVKNSVKHWYLLTISGIIFVALGVWVFATPEESYLALSVIFSLSFLITGIFEIVFSISNRKELEGWGWTLTAGIFSAVVGVLLLIYPEVSVATLPFFVGFMVMYRSIYAIALSMELKDYGIMDWGNLLALGIVGLLFSFLLLADPLFSGLSLVVVTGIVFIVLGFYTIYYSMKLRKINKAAKGVKEELKKGLEDLKQEIYNELTAQ